VSAWYRDDGGWIDRIDPYTLALQQKNANFDQTKVLRVAAVWAPTDQLKITPSFYYQDRYRNDVENYWGLYSNPSSNQFVDANPTQRTDPDTYWISAIKIEGDLGAAKLISNTSYFHRREETGYDGTLYNLGFYQTFLGGFYPLIDANGLHLPPTLSSYYAPASIDNGQENFAQEVRLQSNDPSSACSGPQDCSSA
jgi:iron complex outermembrane recepter protein